MVGLPNGASGWDGPAAAVPVNDQGLQYERITAVGYRAHGPDIIRGGGGHAIQGARIAGTDPGPRGPLQPIPVPDLRMIPVGVVLAHGPDIIIRQRHHPVQCFPIGTMAARYNGPATGPGGRGERRRSGRPGGLAAAQDRQDRQDRQEHRE